MLGKHWARDTCEVISVHSMEQQEADEKDESEASDDHSAQRETVATFSLNDLGGNKKITQMSLEPFPHFSGISITLTEPTRTCITISPIPALVTRTDVAHPAQKMHFVSPAPLPLNTDDLFPCGHDTLIIEDVFGVGEHAGEYAAEEQPA